MLQKYTVRLKKVLNISLLSYIVLSNASILVKEIIFFIENILQKVYNNDKKIYNNQIKCWLFL